MASWEEIFCEEANDPIAVCREYWGIVLPVYLGDSTVVRRMRADFCDEPSEAIRSTWIISSALFRSFGEWDWRPMLSAIQAPVLIVKGDRSTMPKEWTQEWAEALPNARMLWLPDAADALWVARPALFFSAADQFLRGEWPEEAVTVKELTKK